MRGASSFCASMAGVVALGFGGLQYIDNLIPSFPSLKGKLPAAMPFKGTPKVAPPVVAPVPGIGAQDATKGSKAKALVASPLAKAGAVGAGIWISGKWVPLQMNKTGECYVETMDGIRHVPCSEAKGESQ